MAGKVVHFTIPIDDPQRAIPFYEQAFGWRIARVVDIEGNIVGIFQRDPSASP